jgi:hypothetical protein
LTFSVCLYPLTSYSRFLPFENQTGSSFGRLVAY